MFIDVGSGGEGGEKCMAVVVRQNSLQNLHRLGTTSTVFVKLHLMEKHCWRGRWYAECESRMASDGISMKITRRETGSDGWGGCGEQSCEILTVEDIPVA